jgi:hypothetical protein
MRIPVQCSKNDTNYCIRIYCQKLIVNSSFQSFQSSFIPLSFLCLYFSFCGTDNSNYFGPPEKEQRTDVVVRMRRISVYRRRLQYGMVQYSTVNVVGLGHKTLSLLPCRNALNKERTVPGRYVMDVVQNLGNRKKFLLTPLFGLL